MAEKQPKDTLSYKKERDSFLNDLQRFHYNRRTPYQVNPTIRGKDVDLYQLYSKVTAAGGWEKVNEEGRWEEFAPLFNLPEGCTNADQALKRIYIRYLDIYERIHHRGEDPDKQDEYPEEGGGGIGGGLTPGARLKRSKNPLGGVALKYNYHQHKVPPHIRHNYGLSTELMCPTAYAKLERSLLSGLPNEVDFAFNICTLLSNEGKHTLQLDECPLILKYLLAHVAICNPDDGLLALHEEGWKPMSKRNFLRFWYETVEDPEMRNLILPNSLDNPKDGKSSSSASSASSSLATLVAAAEEDSKYSGVLNVGRDLGLRDKEGQRVLQLAIILRNLSFEKGNMFVLSNTNVVFRFLMLCIHSKYGNLRQLALDTLSNMALQMVLEPLNRIKTRLILKETSRAVSSSDKYEVIGGLDLLARLCQVEENEELLSDGLEQDLYDNIVHYLTVHDIQLIVYTLECLYQLSELGDEAGTQIATVQHAVATLVSLVTIEAQSYGPESLRGIKVVEHVSMEAGPATTLAPPAAAASVKAEDKPAPHTQTQQLRPAATLPPPVPSTAPIPTAVAAARAPIPGSSTSGETDSSAVCLKWLAAHYEVHESYMLPRMQLYQDYINACSTTYSAVMQAVANSVSFANCVRMAFPTLELVKVDKADGATDFQYRGLRRRPVPRPFGLHDTSRPGNTATPSPPPGHRPIATRPTNSSAAGAGESTLIKSLLASKLQQNMQKIHTNGPLPSMHQTPPTPQLPRKPHSILQQQLQQSVTPPPHHQPPPPKVIPPQQLPQQLPQQQLQQPLQHHPQQTPQQNTVMQQSPQQPPQQNAVVQQPPQQLPQQNAVVQQPPQQLSQQNAVVRQPPQQLPQQLPQQNAVVQQPPQQLPQQNAVVQQPPQQLPQQNAVVQQAPQQLPQQNAVVQQPPQQLSQQNAVQAPQQQQTLQASSTVPSLPVSQLPASIPEQHSTTTAAQPSPQDTVEQPAGQPQQVSCAPKHSNTPSPAIEPVNQQQHQQSEPEENGPMLNGVCSPGSSQPPTPLSLNPDEEDMDIKECDDKANDSIEEKKAQIKKLMQDTKVIRDTYLSNGLVCHNSNGDSNKVVKENGQVRCNEQPGGPVLENGCPSPAPTPPVNGHNNPSGEQTSLPATVTNQQPQQQTPVISDNNQFTVNNNATPPTPNPTPELPPPVASSTPASTPCIQPPAPSQDTAQLPASAPVQQQQLPPTAPQANVPAPPVQQQQQLPQQMGGAQHVVIQQGGQQHVVQLGQPLAQQLGQQQQQPQQQPQQQQQQPQQQGVQNGPAAPGPQQQQQQFVSSVPGGIIRAPVLPPQPPPQQVLQVQVPPGQQVMQVRMPPSNGQTQILHVHVPQGPGQPQHIMQVAIPPAPNGQAQTVQVQVRPNTQQQQQPTQAPGPRPLPPYPQSHVQQQQQQHVLQQPQQQMLQQGQPQPQLQPQQQQQQQINQTPPAPAPAAAAPGGTIQQQSQQAGGRLVSPGQQHPLLQQHLQHPQPSVSPTSRKRPPTPTQQSAAKRKRPLTAGAPAKKGKRTDSVDSNQSAGSSSTSLPSPALPTLTTLHYMCEWKDCHKPSFDSQKDCHKHVMCEHFDRNQSSFRCSWEGCDGLTRGRWSFVQHLQDRHLSEQALKAAALRRQQQAAAPPPPQAQPLILPPPPVYPNDAALQAIRRFAIKPPYQQFVEPKEGPVTKHIRLTSALILRNLARYSALGRSLIKQHEQHLAYVAFSSVEASNALSHCLSELQKH